MLVAAGGFHDDARGSTLGQRAGECAMTFGVVGEVFNAPVEPEGHVERGLGDIDADDGGRIEHVEALSCDAGVAVR